MIREWRKTIPVNCEWNFCRDSWNKCFISRESWKLSSFINFCEQKKTIYHLNVIRSFKLCFESRNWNIWNATCSTIDNSEFPLSCTWSIIWLLLIMVTLGLGSGEQTVFFLESVVYFINPRSTVDSLNHFVGSNEWMRVLSVDAKHKTFKIFEGHRNVA